MLKKKIKRETMLLKEHFMTPMKVCGTRRSDFSNHWHAENAYPGVSAYFTRRGFPCIYLHNAAAISRPIGIYGDTSRAFSDWINGYLFGINQNPPRINPGKRKSRGFSRDCFIVGDKVDAVQLFLLCLSDVFLW